MLPLLWKLAACDNGDDPCLVPAELLRETIARMQEYESDLDYLGSNYDFTDEENW